MTQTAPTWRQVPSDGVSAYGASADGASRRDRPCDRRFAEQRRQRPGERGSRRRALGPDRQRRGTRCRAVSSRASTTLPRSCYPTDASRSAAVAIHPVSASRSSAPRSSRRPYLFKGARPTITSAPSQANYGQSFFVATPDGGTITKVALIPQPTPTHAYNSNSGYVPLTFSQTAGGLTVTGPANGNIAPPGMYMLFVVKSNGVPSVASWVRISAASQASPTALRSAGPKLLGYGSGSPTPAPRRLLRCRLALRCPRPRRRRRCSATSRRARPCRVRASRSARTASGSSARSMGRTR